MGEIIEQLNQQGFLTLDQFEDEDQEEIIELPETSDDLIIIRERERV